MTESNKILTVSYGTFSCTLEGFDDPFGTMRGIAEYFRDLAAEDRYFGAEPPTPDVEMLQNIAQRDIQRRVEARIGETGVALRATDGIEDAELSDAAAPVVKEAPAPSETKSDETPAEAEAAKSEPASTDETTPESGPLAFDDEYLMADEPEDAFTIDLDAKVEEAPAPESIAEKLRRIRAVVSRNIEPEKAEDSPFSAADSDDDGSAFIPPAQPKRERALSETIRSITADINDGDDVDGLDATEAEDDADEEHVSLFSDDAEDDLFDPDADDQDDADTDEDISNALTDLLADDMDTPSAEDALPEDDIVENEEPSLEVAELTDGPQANEDVIADEQDDAEAEDDTSDTVLADVIAAVSQQDAHDEDDASQEVEEIESADSAEDVKEPSVNDVFETFPESDPLEEYEDEPSDLEVYEVGAPETDDETPGEREKSAQLEPLSETNGNVGRLLKETDEKFADGDGIRRRRVISQMRAAVAATKAERILTKPLSAAEQAKEEQSPYRRDLDKIMPSEEALKSSAASDEDASTEESAPEQEAETADSKPAPLVLVSSQRVDDEPARVAVPTRPAKRVVSETASFAAFAEEMGAEELPDLLEAAAAYSAFVEGQPHFSRPEIMKRVARIDPALSLSREVGLRSFGMLLRQGKIRKLQRGQFAIADDTRFNPAHRIAGQ